MTTFLAPAITGLPTMKPIRDAAKAAMQANLAEALGDVAAEFGYTGALPEPTISTAFVTSYEQVTQWPALQVVSGSYHMLTPNEQVGGIFEGELLFQLFLENSDPDLLTDLLDYYTSAVWLVLSRAEEQRKLAGAELLTNSLDVQVPPRQPPNAMNRAVQLGVNVAWMV